MSKHTRHANKQQAASKPTAPQTNVTHARKQSAATEGAHRSVPTWRLDESALDGPPLLRRLAPKQQHGALLALQRTHGNAAAQRLLGEARAARRQAESTRSDSSGNADAALVDRWRWGMPAPPTATVMPIVRWSWWKRDKAGKWSADITRLGVGDHVIVRLKLDREAEGLIATPMMFTGFEQFAFPSARWLDKQTYELDFEAIAIGRAQPLVGVMLQVGAAAAVKKGAFGASVEMDAARFLHLSGEANTTMDIAYRAGRTWLLQIADAYGEAWNNFTETLKDQADYERMVQAIMGVVLESSLYFVSGGVGALIRSSMWAKQHGEFLVDGVRDLAKYGIRFPGKVGANGLGAGSRSGAGLTAFPTDPSEWQDDVDEVISDEAAQITRQIKQWQHNVNYDVPGFARDFDPVLAVERALTVKGKRLAEIGRVDKAQEARNFEKGMWKTWLETYGYTAVTRGVARAGTYTFVEENVGGKIEARCKKLGLDIAPYLAVAHRRAKEEADRRNKPSP